MKRLWQIGMLLVLALSGCWDDLLEPGEQSADKTFRALLLDPIPASVTDLQGGAETWQGYAAYLRFKAPDKTIDALVAQRYKPREWDRIQLSFRLPSTFADRFNPAWSPEAIASKECYEFDFLKNGWTDSGTHFLLIDRSSGTVYFYGFGA